MRDDITLNAVTASAKSPQSERATAYRERLFVAWWGWPLPLIIAGLLAAAIHQRFSDLPPGTAFVVLLSLAVGLTLRAGRTMVSVVAGGPDGAELRVADARLPLEFAGEAEVISQRDKRKAMGPDLDPAAFLVHRPWIGTLLRVRLTDEQDPTPYWLFSTRHPERVAAAIRDASTPGAV